MNLEIANRLVALRKDNQLSQEALAEKLGISRQAVSKWERAEASPDTDNLIALAKLYHVSLDELLKIHEEEETVSIKLQQEEPEFQKETEGYLTDHPDAHDGNGTDGEDEVYIGLRGINVKERGGDEVHIGWDGIHVRDKGNEVHIDRHGIYVDGEKVEGYIFKNGRDSAEFPLMLFVVAAYIAMGFCFDLWHPGWLIFFLVPVIGSFIHAVRQKNASLFAYPVLVVFIFLYVGLVYFVWHPTWVIFLTIPLYYSLIEYIRDRHMGSGE